MTDVNLVATESNYHASFRLDPSGQWLVELDEIPEVHSFGRTLGKAREYLVDALGVWLDKPVAQVAELVSFRPPDLPPHVRESVEWALAARELADAETQVASDLTEKASLELVNDARLSLRDAAEVLGLSHQRVQQLIASHDPDKPRSPDPVSEAVESFARALKDFLPGGSREEVGALVLVAAGAFAIAWAQSK
jgi:predicted RNase H-like HicB family nuclease